MPWILFSAPDFAAGACTAALTDTLFFAADSRKVQLQSGVAARSAAPPLSSLLRGLFPVVATGGAPSLGLWCALYFPAKRALDGGAALLLPGGVAALLAAAACAVPATLLSVPSDVVKKQILLRTPAEGFGAAAARIARSDGAAGFFVGWRVNLATTLPFAALKMGLFESFALAYLAAANASASSASSASHLTPRPRRRGASSDELSAAEAAAVGLVSGAATGTATCPLDVVNTRLKAGALPRELGVAAAAATIARREGVGALFGGLAPRCGIIGLG